MTQHKIYIDVQRFSENKRKLVQDAFFKLGFEWLGGSGYHYLESGYTGYTNVHGNGNPSSLILYNDGKESSEQQKPYVHTFNQLMKLSGMEEYMERDAPTFTKDMLISGEHVVKLRDGSYNLVMKDRILDLGGWLSLDHLSEDLSHLDKEQDYNDEDLDIVTVYTMSEYFTLNDLEDGEELTLIWQRESLEKQKQLEVIQTLEEDLKRTQKALEEAKSKLEER